VRGWVVQGTAAGFSSGMALLMVGSGMFSARGRPDTPARYARHRWESRGALWEMRGDGGCAPGQRPRGSGRAAGSAGSVAEARVERGGLRRRCAADLNAQQFAEFPVVAHRAGRLTRTGPA